jgi:site-specific DNA recombinase
VSEIAAIYVRQSINHPEGIERALARTRELVRVRGWSLNEAHVFTDNDTSAKGGNRKSTSGWAKLLKAIEAKEITVVVGVDLDRLIRSISDLGILIKLGAKVTIVDGDLDLTTADGKLRASILTGVAAFEIDRKSERQKRANEYRVSQGRPVPGRRRFGYLADNMTPHPEESTQAQWAFEQVRSGESIRSTAIALGMRPVRVREMLTNPSYRGDVVHKGVAMPSDKITPLVTRELFAEVGAILSDPARRTSPGNTIKYLASGIAVCGVCGAPLHHQNEYMCSASTAHVFIQKRQLDPAIAEEVFFWVVEHPDAEDDDPTGALSPLLLQAAEVARQRTVVQDLATMPGADLADVRRKLAALGRQSEALEERIARERGALTRSGLLEQVRGEWYARRHIKEYTYREQEALDAWPAYWESLGLDKQREIVRSLFRITLNKGRGIERVKFEWL